MPDVHCNLLLLTVTYGYLPIVGRIAKADGSMIEEDGRLVRVNPEATCYVITPDHHIGKALPPPSH